MRIVLASIEEGDQPANQENERDISLARSHRRSRN